MKPRTPLLLLSLTLTAVGPALADVLERVIARVNGDIVTLSEFEQRQLAALQAARVGSEGVEGYLREHNQRILQEAIDDLLLAQRAQDLGIRVRSEYLDEIIEGIKKDNGITTAEQFQEQLGREGLSLDELKRNIQRSVLRRQVLSRELESRTAVPEAEVLADYQAHAADHQRPASVKLQEILVEGDDAEARARQLVTQARAGADFAELARQHSVSSTAKNGGDLGTLVHGELAKDLEQVVFALAPGAVSDPMAAAGGYRILRVVQKNEAGLLPFDQARGEIVQRLSQARMAAEYEKYMEGLRKAAVTIDVRVREVPLQVHLPEAPASTLKAPSVAPAAEGEEFNTTPQARPERIVPPGAPLGDAPKPDEKEPPPPPGS